MAGDHAGDVEVVHQRPHASVRPRERQHVPERPPRVAPVGVSRKETQAPVEVADHRFGERERRAIGRRERIARGRELFGRNLLLRAEPPQRVGRVLQHR